MLAETDTSPADEAVASFVDRMIDAVTLSHQDALESVESARHAMLHGMAQVQGEIATFVGERVLQDLEVQAQLWQCRDLADLRALQSRYLRAAIDQYAGEASRLMRIGADIAARSLEHDGY